MAFDYISVEEAMQRDGLRMVVVGNVPSPWGEAAKGIFHLKGIDWAAVRVDYESRVLKKWAGGRNGPIAIYNDEPPRAGWAEILLLGERLASSPSLLPLDPEARALAMGLSHEICGEQGLGWSRRLQGIHAGLLGQGGFAKPVAEYLAMKYGYTPEAGGAAGQRVAEILSMLVSRLKTQRDNGSSFYLGSSLSVVDIYSATFTAMFSPLPEKVCAMDPRTRKIFEAKDEITSAAFDPILIEHRDRMYAKYLALPLSL